MMTRKNKLASIDFLIRINQLDIKTLIGKAIKLKENLTSKPLKSPTIKNVVDAQKSHE